MSHIEERSAGLSEYEQYVLDALYCQETQTLGRELTLGERRNIRTEYVEALRRAALAKKRGYKRTAKADEIKDFEWKPSVSSRKIRSYESK